MVEPSWDGSLVPQIADELRCSQKTVRRWLHHFNRLGLGALEDLGRQGRKRRITEAERSRIVGLVKQTPPGRLEVQPSNEMWAADESVPSEWTLDSRVTAARGLGIVRLVSDRLGLVFTERDSEYQPPCPTGTPAPARPSAPTGSACSASATPATAGCAPT